MPYHKGDLDVDDVMDSNTENYDSDVWAYLPHRCQEWVIGGIDELEALRADISDAIEKLAAKKP